jgi:hypothetical protein
MARLVGVILFAACGAPSVVHPDGGQLDAGEQDPGYAIPPEQWVDGGQGDAWGCFGRSLDRFIVRMETRDGADPWCASILFRRSDGGTPALFPDFAAPAGFEIVDARWAPGCGGLELSNGDLNHVGTRPVHEFSGDLVLQGFVMDRPRGYDIDAGIRLAYRRYWFSQRGSLSATCAGP